MNIWETKLDNKFDIRVERVDEYKGTLIIADGNTKIAEGLVSLAYGAPFGPDIGDIADWQNWSANFIDGSVDVGPLKGIE